MIANKTTTEKMAQELGILPGSVRSRVCRTGSYFGIVPDKLPSGRLLWPKNVVELLLEKGKK